MEFKSRKSNRLIGYDYSTSGAYFITICTKNRKEILSKFDVGTGVLDCPKIKLSWFGEIADKYINQLNDFYDNISVDKYVIMPDHIHLLVSISNNKGQSRTPVPTNKTLDNKNSVISKFISTFKRFSNKEFGENIWQDRYYDHIIRGEEDYREIWQYNENNPLNSEEDHFWKER